MLATLLLHLILATPTLTVDDYISPFNFTYNKSNAELGSKCNLSFYLEYGIDLQSVFYNNKILQDPTDIKLVNFDLTKFLKDEKEHNVSTLICNGEENGQNIPLMCGATGLCECLRSKELGDIWTVQEIGTTGCLGDEGSFCFEEDPYGHTDLEREVNLFCAYGYHCVHRRCRDPLSSGGCGYSSTRLLMAILTLFHITSNKINFLY